MAKLNEPDVDWFTKNASPSSPKKVVASMMLRISWVDGIAPLLSHAEVGRGRTPLPTNRSVAGQLELGPQTGGSVVLEDPQRHAAQIVHGVVLVGAEAQP